MKLLLLHPEDSLSAGYAEQPWDLIIDVGRSPVATRDRWSRKARCPVVSIYDYAEEIEDLHRLRGLLQLGSGRMVDQRGIDWWDVLSLEIVPQLQQFILIHRLSKTLNTNCDLYSSRPHPLATALQKLLGVRHTVLEKRLQSVIRDARRYQRAFSRLDNRQIVQVMVDKFDNDHSIRRRFARRSPSMGKPVVLLPSAYINVSRVALSYADLLPDHQFLLVHVRGNAKVAALPPNVRSVSLTPYFAPGDPLEIGLLIESWTELKTHLACSAELFKLADAMGLFAQLPPLLHWGLALRNAWAQVFESENVIACLSGDASNPPSSIPLIMAWKRGLLAVACHHGALNYMTAIESNRANLYLAKSRMERDYLRRICKVAKEKIVVAPPIPSEVLPLQPAARRPARWLVFFTEPYTISGWRSDEVYRDLLPRLWTLAQTCGLQLVFKLHPFESIKGHRKLLRRLVPEYERQIEVLAGPPSDRLWRNVRLALTVQSSTAVECAARGIPVFICAWLRDSWSGYVQQFARFGVGHELRSPEQIEEIPELFEDESEKSFQQRMDRTAIDSDDLADLFSGTYSVPLASQA